LYADSEGEAVEVCKRVVDNVRRGRRDGRLRFVVRRGAVRTGFWIDTVIAAMKVL